MILLKDTNLDHIIKSKNKIYRNLYIIMIKYITIRELVYWKMVIQMIKCVNITKSYFTNSGNFEGISKVNITFKSKGIYLITGESGSGKSTFLNCISGKKELNSGSIYIKNNKISADKLEQESNAYLTNNITYITQQDFLLEDITSHENIKLYFKIRKKRVDEVKLNEYAVTIGISHKLKCKVKSLSGGEKQKIAIIIAYLSETPILILDEPTSSLDNENSDYIIKSLIEMSKNKLVIVSTHNTEFLTYDGITQIINFSEGKITEKKAVRELGLYGRNDTVELHYENQNNFFNRYINIPLQISFYYIFKKPLKLLKTISINILLLLLFVLVIGILFDNSSFVPTSKSIVTKWDNTEFTQKEVDTIKSNLYKTENKKVYKYSDYSFDAKIKNFYDFETISIGIEENINISKGRNINQSNEILVVDYLINVFPLGTKLTLSVFNYETEVVVVGVYNEKEYLNTSNNQVYFLVDEELLFDDLGHLNREKYFKGYIESSLYAFNDLTKNIFIEQEGVPRIILPTDYNINSEKELRFAYSIKNKYTRFENKEKQIDIKLVYDPNCKEPVLYLEESLFIESFHDFFALNYLYISNINKNDDNIDDKIYFINYNNEVSKGINFFNLVIKLIQIIILFVLITFIVLINIFSSNESSDKRKKLIEKLYNYGLCTKQIKFLVIFKEIITGLLLLIISLIISLILFKTRIVNLNYILKNYKIIFIMYITIYVIIFKKIAINRIYLES